jgi:hypothetical protein
MVDQGSVAQHRERLVASKATRLPAGEYRAHDPHEAGMARQPARRKHKDDLPAFAIWTKSSPKDGCR